MLGITSKPDYNFGVAKSKDPKDLSVNELRRLLIEKRRSGRYERIERYRETGRVVRLISDEEETSWDDVMYKIYVRQKIEKGLADCENGRVLTTEQVKEHFAQKR